MPGSTEAAEHSRKIAGVISEVMIESSTEHDLLGPRIAAAPKASLKDHTGRGAAGLCEDRPRPNRRKKTLRTKLFAAFGAGDEARTRYLHLGKVALYRMSYTRNSNCRFIIAEVPEKSSVFFEICGYCAVYY